MILKYGPGGSLLSDSPITGVTEELDSVNEKSFGWRLDYDLGLENK